MIYSSTAMQGEGFGLLIDHLRDGGDLAGQWRTVARLLKFRRPARAARLGALLLARSFDRQGLRAD